MQALMSIANRIVALHLSGKLAAGTPVEVPNNRDVITSYLGVAFA